MAISRVGVIGLGTMGAGIAEVIARNGYSVVAIESSTSALEHGREMIENSTQRAVKRGKLSEADRVSLLDRIHFTTQPSASPKKSRPEPKSWKVPYRSAMQRSNWRRRYSRTSP